MRPKPEQHLQTCQRGREAVWQGEGEKGDLASLDDVDHRITILGEAVNGSIQRIEKYSPAANVIETSDAVKLRAAQRAIESLPPFRRRTTAWAMPS